nr:uncharacterized protein CTRU02_05138 [Colletotrichum truncatum]KAF6794306.1 hypothetical protein CTRU02_05138 [Colletotrichum truncatum]
MKALSAFIFRDQENDAPNEGGTKAETTEQVSQAAQSTEEETNNAGRTSDQGQSEETSPPILKKAANTKAANEFSGSEAS